MAASDKKGWTMDEGYARLDTKLDGLAVTLATITSGQATLIEQTKGLTERAVEDRAKVEKLELRVDQIDREVVRRSDLSEASRRLYIRLTVIAAGVGLGLQGLAIWLVRAG